MAKINRVEYTIDGDSVDNPKYVWESGSSSGVIQFKGKTNEGLSGVDLIDVLGDYLHSSGIPVDVENEIFPILCEIQKKIAKLDL